MLKNLASLQRCSEATPQVCSALQQRQFFLLTKSVFHRLTPNFGHVN